VIGLGGSGCGVHFTLDPYRDKRTVAGFGVGHFTDIRSPRRGGRTIKYIHFFRTTFVIVPHPALVVLTAILPVVRWRVRRPKRAGLCPTCGYDLRATPARCPECGAVPTGATAATGNVEV
jgi:hypothetical protein